MSIVKQSLVGASGQGGGYTINDSLRFRRSASAYLSRTPASAGNRRTWTWSGWVKRGKLGDNQNLFSVRTGATTRTILRFASDSIDWLDDDINFRITTSAVYRDPSAWYHIIAVINTTQATSTNRLKLYVNGEQVTSLSNTNYPSQNYEAVVNSTLLHAIGREGSSSNDYLDGYITEVNFIDGQALDPTDFGEFDEDTGVWKPKRYTGTYGTNGFYLNGVGVTDQSGNGNNWTNNNLNLSTSTATTYDQMKDTPSLVDEDAGNFATLNPLDGTLNYDPVDANLKVTLGGVLPRNKLGTMAVSSGKFYWEMFIESATTAQRMGVSVVNVDTKNDYFSTNTDAVSYSPVAGDKIIDGSSTAYGDTFTTGDTIGVALNLDDNEITFYKNGVSQGVITSKTFTGSYLPSFTHGSNSGTETIVVNFGQRPLAYTPPTGFKKLNTFNLPDSTIEDGSQHFEAITRNGFGSSGGTVATNFQADLIWEKPRNAAYSHYIIDNVRGIANGTAPFLSSNTTSAEQNANWYLPPTSSTIGFNSSDWSTSTTLVDWIWKANGSGVSNTVGDIPSTVSANTTAGFSIVSYEGTGANATVGHGLSAAPDMLIVKNRSGVYQWIVQHSSLGATKYLTLSTTDAEATSSAPWNNTAPTSTVFSLGTSSLSNRNANNFIAYCFAEVPGYSAFGSYTGNGSTDGPFVYTGFRPKFFIIKQAAGTNAGTSNWIMMDTVRGAYNAVDMGLAPNLTLAEFSPYPVDFLSNGFKFRTTNQSWNKAAGVFIYMAFAENPFKNANAR